MSDILSQEQIDALLNSDGLGTGSDSSSFNFSDGSASSIDKYPVLDETFELFCSQAGGVISTVLNKSTVFTPQNCQAAVYQSIQEKITSVVVSIGLSFKSGIDGEFYVLMQKKDVAILSDLMMMGDGTAEYSEDHKDAIGELFNQVMGAYTNVLGTERAMAVSAGPITVNDFDLDNPPLNADSLDMIISSLKIEGMVDSWIAILLPSSISEQIVEKSANSSDSAASSGSGSANLNMSELDDLSRVTSFESPEGRFTETTLSGRPLNAAQENINMLLDIELDVSIELGRSILSIKKVLELAPGSIVELDRLAGEPVDLLVNNKVVAKGEIVVIDENFGIRIVSLVSPEERIKSLK